MKRIIIDGTTILQMPPAKRKTSGTRKTPSGRFRAYVCFDSKKYFLGTHDTQAEAMAIRDLAKAKIDDGTFFEWFENFKKGKNEGMD